MPRFYKSKFPELFIRIVLIYRCCWLFQKLRDQQMRLKIMVTEKMIASDQHKNLPSTGYAKLLDNDLQAVIDKIKAITN